MFWDTFYSLCHSQKKSPNAVAKDLGISSGAVTSWKQGKVPHHSTLLKIADYFGTTVDYLLGRADESKKPSAVSEGLDGNTVIMRGRDGSVLTKKLTDDQVKALKIIIDQLPDAPEDL